MIKPCKYCGSDKHLRSVCYRNPRHATKIPKRQKVTEAWKRWEITRADWFKRNLPNEEDGYNCFYCGRFLFKREVELDHYHSRSRHPELKYELSNLRPSCHSCNFKKGSIDGDDFKL